MNDRHRALADAVILVAGLGAALLAVSVRPDLASFPVVLAVAGVATARLLDARASEVEEGSA